MKVVLCCAPIMDSTGDSLIPIGQDSPPSCPSLAIYTLVAVLRQHGHDVTMIDFTAAGTHKIDQWSSVIADAELFGISATSLNWPTVLQIILQIRDVGLTTPIVVGGIHATMFPDYLMNRFPIDYVVRYEGEAALLQLCRAIKGDATLADVGNLSWRKPNGQVVHNQTAPLLTVDELVAMPPPAYDLLPPEIYPGVSLQTSRGCSFNCSFCSTAFRNSYRGIPPIAFVDRMEEVMAMAESLVLDPSLMQIVDDEWSLDRKRAIAILDELDRRGNQVRFTFDSRANDFLTTGNPADEEQYVAAVAPHTHRFLVGAECGYDEGLQKIGKGTTVAKLEGCAKLLAKYGIAQCAEYSFILGLPWEGKEEVLKTVRLAARLALKYGVQPLLQWYCQIPGSLLWDNAWKAGKVSAAMYDEFGFFRNLYLFRTAVNLTPEEIWEVMDVIYTSHSLIVMSGRPHEALHYRPPAPIEINYPPERLAATEGSANPLIWTRDKRDVVVRSQKLAH